MKELVFFLEERSAEVLVEAVMPRLFPTGVRFRCIVFEGKQDLEKRLAFRMRRYLNPKAHFVVLRDQDSADCHDVKTGLLAKCKAAGRRRVLVRIACHELESWYLADLAAVERGLDLGNLRHHQGKQSYRDPDRLGSPKRELIRLTGQRYQEVGGSRAIAPHLDLENVRSRSFSVFLSGLRKLMEP